MSEGQIDPRDLRNAFGSFATGVTVVTTLDDRGDAVGITANSFASVSLEPPLLLWCLYRRSVTFEIFDVCTTFVVSVLNVSAAPIASRFAMKGGHSAEGVETVPTELGPPTFVDALAVFECDTHARYEAGDHVILVGRVRRFTHFSDPDRSGPGPLLFYRSRYGNLTPLTG